MSSMFAMPAVHQEVAERAEQENEVRQHSQYMSAMFRPKKESRRDQEHDDGSPIEVMSALWIVA